MDLAELEAELAHVRSALDGWATQQEASAAEGRDAHTRFLADQDGALWWADGRGTLPR